MNEICGKELMPLTQSKENYPKKEHNINDSSVLKNKQTQWKCDKNRKYKFLLNNSAGIL